MRAEIDGPLAETAAGAIAAEVLRACVHCGMCNATCPTYQLTGDELDGPRGRIYLIKEALAGAPIGRTTQIHLDRCLSCRACETTCPSGVEYHRLFDIGRQEVAARVRRPVGERLSRWALRAIVPYPKRLRALAACARVVRPLLPRALAGKLPRPVAFAEPAETPAPSRRMTMLAGCAQAALAPHVNAATKRVFARVGIGLDAAPGAGCCGALSFHLDAPDEGRGHARRNIDAWTRALDDGAEGVLVNASGCAAFIRDYPDILADDETYAAKARRIAGAVRDPVEMLDAADLRFRERPTAPRVAVHEPCTLRNGPGLSGRVAALLGALGYEVQPVRDAHLCCGSAGAWSLLQPKFAGRLRA
ncbi:MAG: glycolate oxidase subunit GlcF, partial [Caulobacteraceae bacterium]